MYTRRVFLRLLGVASAAAALPFPVGCGDNADADVPLFFDAHQWATVDAATALILPAAERGISASDARAVRYIDRLLAAFDQVSEAAPPTIFAGGPASGRQPAPDAHGKSTSAFPPADMATFLPLTRAQEIAWRVRIFGSAATPGGDFNDALLGPTVGWRDLYTDAVTRLDAVAAATSPGATFLTLGPADQQIALATVSSEVSQFGQALIEHTLEGVFCVPEYGGNADRAGWRLARYDGDSIPLGHAVYDASIDAYVDRPEEPTSTPSPHAISEDFDSAILDALTVAAVGSGGKKFF